MEIIEAKNLEAKDANGFSDPYCMLGIIPGNRAKLFETNSGSDEENIPKNSTKSSNKAEQKSSFIKRFSSFRRSDRTNQSSSSEKSSTSSYSKSKNVNSPGSQSNRIGVIRDKLPAKYIQTTDVKKTTLNPVWNEKFRL